MRNKGQTCGYWPDSTKDAFDKVNVRNGQYWLWSPVHFFAAVTPGSDATKVASIADVPTRNLIGWFTGDVAPPAGIDPFQAEINSSTVPKCAMQAWRSSGDLQPPVSYAPPASCSCKFDVAVGNVNKPSSCHTCSQDSDCSTNHCRFIGPPIVPFSSDAGVTTGPGANVGYCEVN